MIAKKNNLYRSQPIRRENMRIKALIPILYVTFILKSPVVGIDRELVKQMATEL